MGKVNEVWGGKRERERDKESESKHLMAVSGRSTVSNICQNAAAAVNTLDTHNIPATRHTQTHTDTHRHTQTHTDTHRHTQTHTDTQ